MQEPIIAMSDNYKTPNGATALDLCFLERLTIELLELIAYFLSSDPHDIAICRLQSRKLKQGSSPYLITTVIIAERVDVLLKLRERSSIIPNIASMSPILSGMQARLEGTSVAILPTTTTSTSTCAQEGEIQTEMALTTKTTPTTNQTTLHTHAT